MEFMENGMSYYQTKEFTFNINGQSVRVFSKPGFAGWDQVTPAEALLAKYVTLDYDANVLLLGGGASILSLILARQLKKGRLLVMGENIIPLNMCRLTMQTNPIHNVDILDQITLLPEKRESLDAVVVVLPKGRKLARRWLVEAYHCLKTDGHLYLAGANKEGIQSILKDVQDLFGQGTILGYKKGNRIGLFTRHPQDTSLPAWSNEPGISPGTWYPLDIQIRELVFHLHTLPGVFSHDHLDEGTSLLVSNLSIPENARILDIGCGYGIIGLSAARMGAAYVEMVDSSLLAVASARENIARSQVTNVIAINSDLMDWHPKQPYDLILSNPPFHSGKNVDYQIAQAMIQSARQYLIPGGSFVIVANRFIRYDRLMSDSFGNVQVAGATGKYHILKSSL